MTRYNVLEDDIWSHPLHSLISFLSSWLWAVCFTSVILNCFICKNRMIFTSEPVQLVLQGFYEIQMIWCKDNVWGKSSLPSRRLGGLCLGWSQWVWDLVTDSRGKSQEVHKTWWLIEFRELRETIVQYYSKGNKLEELGRKV